MKRLSVVLVLIVVLASLPGGLSHAGGPDPRPFSQSSTTSIAELTTTSSSQYLSLSAADFIPYEDGYDYENDGRFLAHYHSPGGGMNNGWYLAPVQLPQGAAVTKMTYYFFDDSTSKNTLAKLQRSDMAGHYYDMASVTSSGYSLGFGNYSDTTINTPDIDNLSNSYWVILDIPVYKGAGYDADAVAVVLEYTPPSVDGGVICISAAAFSPRVPAYDYENHGRYLIHYHSTAGGGMNNGSYKAPVILPHGATVTKFRFYFFDDSVDKLIGALLMRGNADGLLEAMAGVDSAGYASGYGNGVDTTIAGGVIDNLSNSYWVEWDSPVHEAEGSRVAGVSVIIEYSPPTTNLGILSIASPAFTPYVDGYDYDDWGVYLIHMHSSGGGSLDGWYLAPVSLPQGVTVDKMTFHFVDDSASKHVMTQLWHGNLANLEFEMGQVDSGSYSGGPGQLSDTTIVNPVIDNQTNSYWIWLDTPIWEGTNQTAVLSSVVLEYSRKVYLPHLRR